MKATMLRVTSPDNQHYDCQTDTDIWTKLVGVFDTPQEALKAAAKKYGQDLQDSDIKFDDSDECYYCSI